MRFRLPSRELRRTAIAGMRDFYQHQDRTVLAAVLKAIGDVYELPPPRIIMRKRRWANTLGKTYEGRRGPIVLIHPDVWARHRVRWNTEEEWVEVFLHEVGHWLLWADAERKADVFAERFARGVL